MELNRRVRDIVALFFVSRLVMAAIAYLSSLVIVKGAWWQEFGTNIFVRWDVLWYLRIVKNGYAYIPGHQSSIHFFPLYPLLVKAVSFITGHPLLVGIVLSNLFLLAASFLLYSLCRQDYDDAVAFGAVRFLLICPVSFFFSIMYSESLFLLFVLGAFYAARKRQWMLASVLGFLCALTRSVGFLIVVPLLVEYFHLEGRSIRQALREIRADMLWLALVPMGLVTFMLYTYLRFGDMFAPLNQSALWNQRLAFFTTTFTNPAELALPLFNRIIFYGAVVVTLLLIILLIIKKVRASYVVYCAWFLWFYVSASILEAMPRYVSVLFPLYIGAALLARDKTWDFFLTSTSVVLLGLFTTLFVNGYWFT
ncbi:MAG: mannosyltransferase family protein [Nanoarchaeota archaeon]